jgi:NTP pyrophosphatase (non-canonical NTP hydrolase)
MSDIQKLQQEVWQNKLSKGFNTIDVNLEFNFTHAELAEAFQAYRKKLPDLGEELADVVIYMLSLAAMLNINLEDEIKKKITKNKNRKYKKIDGVNIRIKTNE